MAVLQKIRNKSVLLVTLIAVALFLFVVGDALRGGEGLFQQSKQVVGEINGESVSIQDYQEITKEYQNFYEIMSQKSSFSEQELNQINDEAWNNHIQNTLINEECEKLGIAVSDNEIADILRTGQSQFLQTPIFMNQQGRFDYTQVQRFLTEYKEAKANGQVSDDYEKIYNYYMFCQKAIRNQLLTQKYQILLSSCFLSNPVEAKLAFDNKSAQTDVLLAAVPFTSIDDKDVKISDEEIKAKYNSEIEKYALQQETRDIKFIDVVVTPSAEDKAEAEKEMDDCYNKLVAATNNDDAAEVVRVNSSLLDYSNVFKTKDAFTLAAGNARFSAISNLLDSAAVGQTVKTTYDAASNLYYTAKVLEKETKADSVLFRQIGVAGKDEADSDKKADSIMVALNNGASFKDIAKKYAQKGDSAWVTTAQFARAQLDEDNSLLINSIYSMSKGETKKVKFSNGVNVILQVIDTKDYKPMYKVAAVVKPLNFSKETFNNKYNEFSSFVAANKTIESLEANAAKKGYTVFPAENLSNASHNIYNIKGTHDALRWVFDEAEVGEISDIYDCGDHNHLLVVALTGINKEGYYSIDKVKDYIKQQLTNEKKAEMILANVKNVKSFTDASKVKNAVTDTVRNITFNAPTFVRALNASEPVVSAAATKTAKGQFAGPVKGNNGVYMLQVINKNKSNEKFDVKNEQTVASQNIARTAFYGVMQVLAKKANISDTRYKFF
ncbi:MAG: SurA N-terminal domain-containing protein [Bacteroidaceae bacterium]|nr:SurA N-terminal domain-containing protein [Bacteroidaceae bacterium]